MNKTIVLHYLYVDADNYKAAGAVTLVNDVTMDQRAEILALCEEEFIPGQVGLPDLQNQFNGGLTYWDEDSDHPYHLITAIEDGLGDPSADAQRASEIFARIMACAEQGWDDSYRPPFYDQMVEHRHAFQHDPDAFMQQVTDHSRTENGDAPDGP
jgi:hypothetical protein